MFPLYQDYSKVCICIAVVIVPASGDKWCIQPLFRHFFLLILQQKQHETIVEPSLQEG